MKFWRIRDENTAPERLRYSSNTKTPCMTGYLVLQWNLDSKFSGREPKYYFSHESGVPTTGKEAIGNLNRPCNYYSLKEVIPL